jgi:hypothetical protein
VLESASLQGERSDLRTLLLTVLDEETTYRARHSEQYVGPKKSESEIEYFYYRHGLLKKFLARPLHIQNGPQAGAGLPQLGGRTRSGTRWTLGQDCRNTSHAHVQCTRPRTQRLYGRDALCPHLCIQGSNQRHQQGVLQRGSENPSPDYRVALRYDWIDSSLSNRSVELGAYRDFVRYLSPQTCPDDIVYLRKLKGRRDIGEEHLETVLHYNKALTVRNASILSDIPGITALRI